MPLKAIQTTYEKRLNAAHREVDAKCSSELIRLCRKSPVFGIRKVFFGNGDYAIDADELPFYYEDEPDETSTIRLDTFMEEMDWEDYPRIPKASRRDLDNLRKIKELIDFWIDVTWGQDTIITYD